MCKGITIFERFPRMSLYETCLPYSLLYGLLSFHWTTQSYKREREHLRHSWLGTSGGWGTPWPSPCSWCACSPATRCPASSTSTRRPSPPSTRTSSTSSAYSASSASTASTRVRCWRSNNTSLGWIWWKVQYSKNDFFGVFSLEMTSLG